ncbi:hypothetical protein FGF66_07235 [Chlorobaculum thiosulfatiphilum]|uniref:Uncharacterized protein n=1 Tax=Chlorobaculum thiosulfatiphilum TaxID=115852 RepID=A0A5C4S5I8_CHLTI|nr:hypothetical protein [Chlorobaculum thiosulfatiphilum]TNJ38770.1 hypothetical protein FGF66_07235 [Chlorobaculum thiosulfatiphilum]
MSDILDFLNKNAGAFSIIFTAVVTLATISYAILTYWLVKETSLMRQVQTEPKIEITVRCHEVHINIMRLHVRNIGLGPAFNVKFTPKALNGGDAASKLIDALTESNFFNVGLAYISPGQEFISGYTNMTEDGEEKIKAIIGFDVMYESVTRKIYNETLIVDMSEHKGTRRIGGYPPLYSIAQSLERIQKDFDHILSGFKKLKVDIFSSEDRALAEAERREYVKQELEKISGKKIEDDEISVE